MKGIVNMKSIVKQMLLFLLIPSLAACSSTGNPSSDSHTQASDTVTESGAESETEELSVTTDGKENWPESVTVPAPDPEKNTQEVIYKSVNGIDLEMTIYQPTNRVYEKAPVFYMIVGGGWEAIDRSAMVLFCKDTIFSLRKQGFAVANIDYRVREQVDGMDDIVSDCMDGIRYLTYYANVLGIDAEKIFTCGHSAGGHLALTVALADQEKFLCDSEFAGVTYQVSGVVGLAAPSMMRTYNGKHILHYHYPVLTALMGEDETKDIWGDVDPYHLITKDMPPILLLHGTTDDQVYSDSSVLFHEQAVSEGADVTLILSENAGHSFEKVNAKTPSPTWTELQSQIVTWILSRLT